MIDGSSLSGTSARHRFSLSRTTAELLSKRWMDGVAPTALLVLVVVYFGATTEGFLYEGNLVTVSLMLAEIGLLALALTVVIVGGGIDLSVGGIFAVANAVAVVLFKVAGAPVPVVLSAALGIGVVCGLFNGLIISYLKTRPFITTLVTLLLFRSIATYLDETYSAQVGTSSHTDVTWDLFMHSRVLYLPPALFILLVTVIIFQIVLRRTRFGWQVTAMGASRKAARHAGMKLERLGLQTYLISGLLSGLAGFLVATRLTSASQATGQGHEFVALTAVIIGGVSLGGGHGTAIRALIGAAVVTLIYQGLLLQGGGTSTYNVVLAVILVLFAILDLKYGKNRDKAIQKLFMVPAPLKLGPLEDINAKDSVWKPNTRLTGAEAIGLGKLDGPEDVILDNHGRLYCGDRRGWIWRFSGPDLQEAEILARVGGLPLGMAIDADDNIVICIGGMGLYQVTQDGHVTALATHTRRSWWKLRDESAIRVADDCDIAPDSKIYFSDASTRFDGNEYMFDVIEARPNGRLLCYDPATGKTAIVVKNVPFPNGVCVSHDGSSVLFASTILSRVDRLWIDGPKKGTMEPFLVNLPGMPDNINRASDGGYWLAFAAMRSPISDLALGAAGFRRRMLKQLPSDEWLLPNNNTSCVVKVSADGRITESYWDETQADHSLITSMREHEGYLYLGGLTNNRVGRIELDQSSATDVSEKAAAMQNREVVGGGFHD